MSLYNKYIQFKGLLPTAVIFIECGAFLETFGNDAIIVSKLLDYPLTHRQIADDTTIPNVGIVYHQFDNQIAKLNELGIVTAKINA